MRRSTQVLSAPEVPTITALRDFGFSEKIIERFFRPFLGGIFLDPELATSSRMFRFVYRMFSQGMAAIPNGGMQAIPRQLASHLPTGMHSSFTLPCSTSGKAACGCQMAKNVLQERW